MFTTTNVQIAIKTDTQFGSNYISYHDCYHSNRKFGIAWHFEGTKIEKVHLKMIINYFNTNKLE